jgi:hypothetical protein
LYILQTPSSTGISKPVFSGSTRQANALSDGLNPSLRTPITIPLSSNPYKYRQCILKYSDSKMYGHVTDTKLPNVTFISQKDCRGAFLGDEVVFEMSDDGESGIVIGVLKEGFNPSERAFAICTVYIYMD